MSAPIPCARVLFEDGTSAAADWRIEGRAYGLADWEVTVHAAVMPGWTGKVRLETVLGTFEGEAICGQCVRDAIEVSSDLRGNGLLRYVGPAGEDSP